jgi:vancomycin resistance protein YoaR
LRAGGSYAAALIRRRGLAEPLRAVLIGGVLLTAVGVGLGLAFAGSPTRLAEGVHVAGADVGGLTTGAARKLLEERFERLKATPVVFLAGGRQFRLTPAQLGVRVDWKAAVEAARQQGQGFGPVRGFRRIETRIFGADVVPPAEVYEAALTYSLGRFAREIDRPARDAALRYDGLKPVVVPAAPGLALDRQAAEEVIVRALTGFSRVPVALPVLTSAPTVSGDDLRPAFDRARVAVSRPVRLDVGSRHLELTRRRLAAMIALPAGGRTHLSFGGREAASFLARLARRVDRSPVDAGFQVRSDGSVHVVAGVYGRRVDRLATGRATLAAALSPTNRIARVRVRTAAPRRSTAEAKALGITGTLAAYSTAYAGSTDRIHNLQLAVSLLDGTLVAPGGTFSLNDAVGPRTPERGFRIAPVIVGSEYDEDYGGGTSQVATTVFNAAWEAGLKIAERNPHALYISRYPLGRDATVNYPNLDLKFVNDTAKWILIRGWSTAGGITIGLYGAPTGREVASEAGPLVVRGSPPVERVDDPELPKGERVVEATGVPPSSVTVTRKVYLSSGKLLYDETWSTNYRGEKRVVRVGTKPKPAKTATATTSTETTPTESTPQP